MPKARADRWFPKSPGVFWQTWSILAKYGDDLPKAGKSAAVAAGIFSPANEF
jgi:hypothetical protein